MASAEPQPRPQSVVEPLPQTITPEEYLSLDRAAALKSEYLGGRLVAMAGASRRHNLITANVLTVINTQLAQRPCEVYASDMRVKVEASHDYTYPNVVAVCEEPRFEDGALDILLNPAVVVEVLSSSTQDYDRGTKFALYRTIESLRDYVLISQDRVRVEHYARQGAFQWLLTEHAELGDTLSLPSMGVTLPLSEIYRKVRFGEAQSSAGA